MAARKPKQSSTNAKLDGDRPFWPIDLNDPLAPSVIEFFGSACDRFGRHSEADAARDLAAATREIQKSAADLADEAEEITGDAEPEG